MSGRSVLRAFGVCGALVLGLGPTATSAVAAPADALPPPPGTEAPRSSAAPSEPLPPPPGTEAPAPAPPPQPQEPAPVQRPSQPISDAAWNAVAGRQVVIDTDQGPIAGELIGVEGDTLVVLESDGQVVTIPKSLAKGVRVADPSPAPAPSAPPTVTTVPTPAEPTPPPATGPSPAPAEPGPAATTEPTAAEPPPEEDPAAAMADLDPKPADEGKDAAKDDQGKGEGEPEEREPTKAEQRRKERREKREHALLGAFTMQGATYSHWRGEGINAGHASYAMDFGLGANLTRGFGMYAVAGGLLATKLEGGATKANYGHVAALFAFGGKYYYSTVGAGVGFSRLRFADDTLQKDRGLAMPFKLVGKIPLPKNLYIGLGLTYEFAAVRKFGRFVNAIGGQIVFGRW